jgi:hypothetical protein
MPTDLDPAFARKREAQAKAQAETTIMLVWFIICVGMLGLVLEVVVRSG